MPLKLPAKKTGMTVPGKPTYDPDPPAPPVRETPAIVTMEDVPSDPDYTPEVHDRLPFEVEAEADVSKALAGFKARADAEVRRMQDATDPWTYLVLQFQTNEQKKEFMRKWGLIIPDETLFVDGMKMSARNGKPLASRVPPVPQPRQWPKLTFLSAPLKRPDPPKTTTE